MTPAESDQPVSQISWSDRDHIWIRGHDLAEELIGRVGLGDMAFLHWTGRLPTPSESTVFNAIAITLVEHGLSPSVLSARMTQLGSPDAMQAAIAAGVLGVGSVAVGSTEECARLLQRAGDWSVQEAVAELSASGRRVPGLGHPIHSAGDPRAKALFDLAAKEGLRGQFVTKLHELQAEAERQLDRRLPINATGAVAALACELGLPWQACRGLAVVARAIGIVGHLLEEGRAPLAPALYGIAAGWERDPK